MKRLGLVTLADLPSLKGAGPEPMVTIAIARLDDRLRDPRYGKFKITQADVDGWKRNLAETFGGQVSIDADHSSDRGNGTRAAAWITGINQTGTGNGSLVTADVQFTRWGAKLVRGREYRFTSPTFVADYVDEHGDKHGPALIGAALTNRPVLRKGMPTLSLSRDTFDGVATPNQNGRTVSTKTLKMLSTTTSKKKLMRLLPTLSSEEHNELLGMVLGRADPLGRVGVGASTRRTEPSPDTVMTLAQFAPPGVQYAGTTDWDPPATDPHRMPPGLDDAGRALHGLIASRAASTGQHYFHAMADVTGIPDYRQLSDIPPTPVDQPGLDPERQALDKTARALSKAAGISWLDACNYLLELRNVPEDDGSAAVPWLDSRPLPSSPRPWSDEDWERDKRRANAAGIDIDKGMWQTGAELGHDVVGELAAQQRQDAVATARQRSEGMLDQARAAEDDRRSEAINDELQRRARNRVAENGRPNRSDIRQLPGGATFGP